MNAKDPEPEADALAALERGDWNAVLTFLMQTYGDQIYRHCRHVIGHAATADDVHQLIFVEAYRDLPRFKRRSTLRTWLYTIARHRCIDALRARRRQRAREDNEPAKREPAIDGKAEAETRALRDALSTSLDSLPHETKIAVLLRFQEGLTYEEMSIICDERPATLQARVARALPVLRRYLEERGVSP